MIYFSESCFFKKPSFFLVSNFYKSALKSPFVFQKVWNQFVFWSFLQCAGFTLIKFCTNNFKCKCTVLRLLFKLHHIIQVIFFYSSVIFFSKNQVSLMDSLLDNLKVKVLFSSWFLWSCECLFWRSFTGNFRFCCDQCGHFWKSLLVGRKSGPIRNHPF